MAGYFTPGLPQISPTGVERIPCDVPYIPDSGQAPTVGWLAFGQFGSASGTRNLLDGGDFTTNPFQRGTSFTGITNTATYTADRWFAVGGASSSISVSSQAVTTLPGFSTALQFGRASSNANTAVISLGEVLNSDTSIPLQSQGLVLSFYAIAGANFSPVGANITATLYSGTGTNQSVASLIAGTWTGQTTVSAQTVSINSVLWGTRYSVVFPALPAGTTQVGLVLSFVPVGTAGANDWFQIAGVQLEIGSSPSQFEHLPQAQVNARVQQYAYVILEPTADYVVANGMNTTTAIQKFCIPLPVTMIAVPSITVTTGTFKTNQAGTSTASTITADHATTQAVSVLGSSTGTAGQATLLIGGAGGTGKIVISADF